MLQRLERTNKILLADQQKMKTKMAKMLSRKGKFNTGVKSCNKCKLDYAEKENYNWSCRIHSGDWGGEMYWCCGKTNKDSAGCRLGPHETKDEDEENEIDKFDKDGKRNLANVKCICCKEVGHSIEDCIRDPNIKRKLNAEKEVERIAKI
jgi:hypothetical protein